MHIQQLQLKNYRNYEALDVHFSDNINVIIGENAQGKTNLLEAIYVLAFTKSYRTSREKELIGWDSDYSKITGRMIKRNRAFPLDMIFTKKGKKVKLNHIEQKRLSDYIGALNVVMFAPEDLILVKGTPQNRRRFIDMELGQIQPRYIYHLGNYQKILRQRNHLLKQMYYNENPDVTMLHVLTDQLITHAAALLERRFAFIKLLRKWAVPIHSGISQGLEQLRIEYASTIEVSEEAKKEKIETVYQESFQAMEEKEIRRGTTLIGPHRDDLTFFVNQKDVQIYGSQGQQRTTALSVKLAEIELIYNEIGEYPVLLLDDVLSELDDHRQSHLLHTIQGKVQTFISTTTVSGIQHETIEKARLFHIRDGTIEQK